MWSSETQKQTFNAEKPPKKAVFQRKVVGVQGLEPWASCSQSRRATNCATPRYEVRRSGWAYSPKPPALPTALHPVMKFPPLETAHANDLTFILYINTAQSAIFFSRSSLAETHILHVGSDAAVTASEPSSEAAPYKSKPSFFSLFRTAKAALFHQGWASWKTHRAQRSDIFQHRRSWRS